MKKKRCVFAVLLCFVLTLSQISVVFAAAGDNERIISTERKDLGAGQYVEIVVSEPAVSVFASGTKKGSTTATYYANGEAMWYVKITGNFSYTGSSSKCTSASVSAGSYVSTWKISDKSSSYSGNTATGKATAKLWYGIVAIDTITRSVSVSCSAAGKIS